VGLGGGILPEVKVLLISHNYPPAHTGGTELYTAQLARELKARGHQVVVFCAEKDIGREHLSLSQREHEGVTVHELVNNLVYSSFRETWDFPEVERIFEGVLDRERPDLVHVNHLLYLTVGCVEAATRRGIPVVFTLHDYWLQCARLGQRVHADRSICLDMDESRCAECLGSFRYGNSILEQRVAGWISGIRRVSGLDLSVGARKAGDWLRAKEDGGQVASLPVEEVSVRNRELRERLVANVSRFLSPSAFLRERLIEWGIPAGRLQHLRTGTDLELFAGGERVARGETLRVAFIGSLIPVKGAHVVMEAWERLTEGERSQATLEIHGPSFHDAEYQSQLEALAASSGARMGGALDRVQVAEVLRRTDLLVVPSLWFENQPLVILEALAAGTPLCVSDLGGMAELVEVGRNGFRFPVGDVGALAQLLSGVIAGPQALEQLCGEPVRLPTVSDQLDEIEIVYREILEESEGS
jgi:glycosyltransferase involved in cell wall biosynthesis